eukprot:CAMPEP_0116034008 /NCGR_PEP_ID=MMETSP0321-20121206/19334_1 /TAXON_ID=163516 /ORGANISM="Leptocylindrus danicus var. danicus, Strain B650" /LENGTH=54 /DNA_ID=CAMNT_0003510203 /DNA_START=220 /DNA_END=384 /DNA_ORIENTATION=+
MTALSVPSGIVATSNALRGISAFVDCDKFEKFTSMYRLSPFISLFLTFTSVGAP